MSQMDDRDYFKYSIVKPTVDNTPLEKYTRVIVDSRIRNKTLFPNPNDYEISLDDDINDVIKAQLIYMDMPFSAYMINDSFDKLYLTVGGTPYTLSLPHGDYYTAASFTTMLQTALDDVIGSSVITVTYIESTDKFKFEAVSGSFSINFLGKVNTIATYLGFRDDTDYNSSASIIYSAYRKNFDFNNYIIMDIDQFDLLRSSDSELNKTFAVIPKVNSLVALLHQPYIKFFSTPIARLNKLRIRLYDRFGNPYDFQNQDHRFELLITGYKQKGKYHNMSFVNG